MEHVLSRELSQRFHPRLVPTVEREPRTVSDILPLDDAGDEEEKKVHEHAYFITRAKKHSMHLRACDLTPGNTGALGILALTVFDRIRLRILRVSFSEQLFHAPLWLRALDNAAARRNVRQNWENDRVTCEAALDCRARFRADYFSFGLGAEDGGTPVVLELLPSDIAVKMRVAGGVDWSLQHANRDVAVIVLWTRNPLDMQRTARLTRMLLPWSWCDTTLLPMAPLSLPLHHQSDRWHGYTFRHPRFASPALLNTRDITPLLMSDLLRNLLRLKSFAAAPLLRGTGAC